MHAFLCVAEWMRFRRLWRRLRRLRGGVDMLAGILCEGMADDRNVGLLLQVRGKHVGGSIAHLRGIGLGRVRPARDDVLLLVLGARYMRAIAPLEGRSPRRGVERRRERAARKRLGEVGRLQGSDGSLRYSVTHGSCRTSTT